MKTIFKAPSFPKTTHVKTKIAGLPKSSRIGNLGKYAHPKKTGVGKTRVRKPKPI